MIGCSGRSAAALLLALATAGCQVVPGQGPLAGAIADAAGRSALELSIPRATVFELVHVNADTARLVSSYQSRILSRRFGFGRQGSGALIGVGDQLKVTIFEAGTDGLFSTTESKQISIDLVVQPDGTGAIPYVGAVRFAGRTLEQARASIRAGLEGKAVQPDVVITALDTPSRTVTVAGAVNSSGLIPLSLTGDQIAEVIAKAGGNNAQPFETYVTMTRGNKVARVLLKTIIENPSENIFILPGDQIFLTRDPRTFTLLGETIVNNRIEFGSNDLSLLEAIALGGGGADERVDAKGYFVFRYEEADIVEALLGKKRFHELLNKGMQPDDIGRYPIVYQIDMAQPQSLFVGQTFPINNRDVVYAARHPVVDLAKFVAIVQGPASLVGTAVSVSR